MNFYEQLDGLAEMEAVEGKYGIVAEDIEDTDILLKLNNIVTMVSDICKTLENKMLITKVK